ncbi:MAG: hypothetical protein CMF60_07910 [Magnetococcales bacterium]|nr:hypothetical protein [Magnetococcales bacterium]|tara:strand:+ start:699 stop:1241 length:543 start_codon:yes stop_codon:yes gene_type:complete
MFSKIMEVYHTYVRAYAKARHDSAVDVGGHFALFILAVAILVAGAMLVNLHAGLLVFLVIVPTLYNFAVIGLLDYNSCNRNVKYYAQHLKSRFNNSKQPSMGTSVFLCCFLNVVVMLLAGLTFDVPAQSPEFVTYSAMALFGMYSVIPVLAIIVRVVDSLSPSLYKIGFMEKWLKKHYES